MGGLRRINMIRTLNLINDYPDCSKRVGISNKSEMPGVFRIEDQELHMARKIRSDATVGSVEKRIGVAGVFRDENGRDIRSDKKIGTIRKEAARKSK